MTAYNKADIHIHTVFSDGLDEPEAVVNYAVTQTDLSLIAITDHNTIDGARVAHAYWRKHRAEFGNLEVIKGVEVSSTEGHILGLFLEEDVPIHMSAEDTIRAIHEQGGLAIAAHPFTHLLPFTNFHGVGRRIKHLSLDGVEERSSVPTEVYANVMTAVYNQRHAQHASLGGSDAHHLTMVGKTYTLFPGKTAADFRRGVETKQVQAGGRVNNPLVVLQVMGHLLRRRLPVFLPDDHHFRHTRAGLTVDVTEARRKPLAILHCAGELTAGNADLLKSQGRRLLAAGLSYLIVDLKGVSFVDSTGIGALVALQKRAHQAGGDVFLCGLSKVVALSLRLVRLDRLFRIFDTVASAAPAVPKLKPPIIYHHVPVQ